MHLLLRLCAAALLALPATAAAQSTEASTDTVQAIAPAPERSFPLQPEAELFLGGTLHALSAPLRWGAREWALAGASVGVVALASLADEEGRDFMEANRTDRNTRIENFIEPFGAVRSLEIMGGMLAAGVVLDDAKLRATAAEALASSLVAAGIITPTLQKVIGRAKPRENLPAHTFRPFSGYHSLPSGHATQAFAVASVIATEYEHPAVQVGAYGLAAAVAVSRMYRRSHFVSDVTGAAIIGTATGRAVARWGKGRRAALSVQPAVIDGTAFLVVSF